MPRKPGKRKLPSQSDSAAEAMASNTSKNKKSRKTPGVRKKKNQRPEPEQEIDAEKDTTNQKHGFDRIAPPPIHRYQRTPPDHSDQVEQLIQTSICRVELQNLLMEWSKQQV